MRFSLLFLIPLALSSGAAAQNSVDPAEIEAGKAIFNQDCALCHQADGRGDAPSFPALAGNANLADVSRIVSNVAEGQGNMPPFSDLGATQIAAVGTYVRNSWGNDFGAVDTAEVEAILALLEALPPKRTVWDGVYTEAQAERGAKEYLGPCGLCHGRRLNGAPTDPDMNSTPPLARAKFLRNWEGKSMATLYQYVRATMPKANPGYMSDQVYIDIIAYMLSASDLPAGDEELSTDPRDLSRITIVQ
jgi:mono/diheme cytochrome c family protein